MTYADLNLKYNPFEDVVPSSDHLFWAGMQRQKQDIEATYREAFDRRTRQVVLNWGPWGGGKTFAAKFFSETPQNHIARPEQMISIVISAPSDAASLIKNLIDRIIDTFSPETLGRHIGTAIQQLGNEALIKKIHQRIQNYEIASTIVYLCDPKMMHSDSPTKAGNLLLKYLNDSFDSSKHRIQLKINRPLKGEDNYIQFLAGVLVALASGTIENREKRIFLWIDEVEHLIYYNAKQYRAFSQTIRELSDKVSEHFTIFLNLSLSENEIHKVNTFLGNALESRIHKNIRFRDLTMEDAFLYCKDLISHAQIMPQPNLYAPLTEAIFRHLLEKLPKEKIIPREINKLCYHFLNYVKENNIKNITSSTAELYQKETLYGN
ncbi:MAG: hypothetical protein RLZZ628_85 [Bacteroidota bacterium]|jgi:hypothetical protein